MEDLFSLDLILGFLSALSIAFIPVVNRSLDKATSSPTGKLLFFIVETVEAFEDGKLSKKEVEDAIEQLRELVNELAQIRFSSRKIKSQRLAKFK